MGRHRDRSDRQTVGAFGGGISSHVYRSQQLQALHGDLRPVRNLKLFRFVVANWDPVRDHQKAGLCSDVWEELKDRWNREDGNDQMKLFDRKDGFLSAYFSVFDALFKSALARSVWSQIGLEARERLPDVVSSGLRRSG